MLKKPFFLLLLILSCPSFAGIDVQVDIPMKAVRMIELKEITFTHELQTTTTVNTKILAPEQSTKLTFSPIRYHVSVKIHTTKISGRFKQVQKFSLSKGNVEDGDVLTLKVGMFPNKDVPEYYLENTTACQRGFEKPLDNWESDIEPDGQTISKQRERSNTI